jgi:hypothetical protein
MTGFHFRVQNDAGQWVDADIATMGDAELEQLRLSLRSDLWPSITIGLARFIRDNVVQNPGFVSPSAATEIIRILAADKQRGGDSGQSDTAADTE